MSRTYKHRFATGRALRLESLERRELLAGNVTAQVSGNTLLIKGNNADNVVAVIQLGNGAYAVAGLDTTVNGKSDPFVTNRPVRNISADMGKGNDLIGFSNDAIAAYDFALNQFGIDVEDITGVPADEVQALIDDATSDTEFNLPGSLTVNTGDGNDGVELLGTVGGSLVALLGGGNNVFGLSDARIGGALTVVGGGQADEVALIGATIGGAATLSLGDGANSVDIEGAELGSLSIVTGKHGDVIDISATEIHRGLSIVTGGGNDSVFAHDHDGGGIDVGQTAVINTGGGSDFVEVEGDIGGSLVVVTGDGADGVNIFNTSVGLNLTIDTGAGNDNSDQDVGNDLEEVGGVFLDNVDIGLFAFIYLGAGNDSLDVSSSRARRAYAYGGPGFDTLTIDEATLDALDFFFQTQFEAVN